MVDRDILFLPEQLIVRIWSRDFLRIRRPRQITAHHQRESVLLLPSHDSVEVPTLMIDEEVREGPLLRLHPIEGQHVRVARAHDILHQHVGAVRDVHPMQFRVGFLAVLLVAVVLGPCEMAQEVQTVDLVEDV